jgi:hypothetical protein
MKQILVPVLLALCVFSVVASGQGPTIASAIDREITNVEKQITDAAEAMPEGKFNFSPENLHIAGGDYKGVRTFALQIRHVAASNYAIWSPLTGDEFPKDFLLQPPERSKSTRLRLAVFGVEHAYDHYGQIVEYLRMNGIVPPASR